jgi:hypothetical protein
MSQTVLERVKKSKDLYRKPPIFPHELREVEGYGEGLMECIVCHGFEGTLLHNCPGVRCDKALETAYDEKGASFFQIEDHWYIMLNRARKIDEQLFEAIRNVP